MIKFYKGDLLLLLSTLPPTLPKAKYSLALSVTVPNGQLNALVHINVLEIHDKPMVKVRTT
jgi:hypothetical protein